MGMVKMEEPTETSMPSMIHSFGTLMLSAGVPIESISKMMGHTSIKTTQGYAKVTDDKISEDMDKLMKRRQDQKDNPEQPPVPSAFHRS